jgi:hypothetical protein
MPEICQDIDFNQTGAELKRQCGVQTRNYRAYKNIPEYRSLLLPKGARIILKGEALELRLQNTLPIALPKEMEGKIRFEERIRRSFLKSKMDYCEFFPENSADRLRILKLEIPMDIGAPQSVCYTVESKPTTAQRKAGYAGRLEPLACSDFLRLKAVSEASESPVPEDNKAITGSKEPAAQKKVKPGVEKGSGR